ncbi:MAG: discoidin domain-containing protein [Pirellulales bacterium]|nr:discoidin domain-containing protein [Pirellulales bacterium]
MRRRKTAAAFCCAMAAAFLFAASAQAGLVAYWPLDGDATATVGTSGVPVNAPTAAADRNGAAGGALAFDAAIGQYVSVAGGGGLDGQYVGTISMWVKWSGPQTGVFGDYGQYGTILARQEDDVFSNNLLSLGGADPAAAGVNWSSSGVIPSLFGATPVGNDTWHHVAITFQPHFTGVNELFLDGVSQGAAPGECLSLFPTTALTLGAWVSNGGGFYGSATASLDDVAVFDDILSLAQIGELAAQTKTPLDVGAGTRPAELPLRGVVATASSELNGFSRFAANTTDGVGRGTTWPDGVSGRVDGMWLNNGTFAEPNDLDPWITFDLGEEQPLAKMVLYNYNESYPDWGSFVVRGVKEVEILASTDGVTFTSVGIHEFDPATGDGNNPGQAVDLGGLVARYVKLDVLSRHGDAAGDFYLVGLNEVDFYAVPEPSAALLAALGGLSMVAIWRRRQRF